MALIMDLGDHVRRLRNVQHLLELVRDDVDSHRQELTEKLENLREEDPHAADILEYSVQGTNDLIGLLQAAVDSASTLADGFQ